MGAKCQIDAGQKGVCGLAGNSVSTEFGSISTAWRNVGLAGV